jgi:hypothetical protein
MEVLYSVATQDPDIAFYFWILDVRRAKPTGTEAGRDWTSINVLLRKVASFINRLELFVAVELP